MPEYHQIYTAGYTGWSPAQLKAEADRLGAYLWDIRYKPWSRRPEWQRESLRELFGGMYYHCPALGNRNYNNDGPIELAAPDKSLPAARVMLKARPIILLCGCQSHEHCHRNDAASFLSMHLRGWEPAEHLYPQVAAAPSGLKALTVRQPWAWAIMNAGKDIENRDWSTRYRGTLAIHAAKGMTMPEYLQAARFMVPILGAAHLPKKEELSFGAIVGLVDVVDCVPDHPSPWFMGDFGIVLRNPRPLPAPVPCSGALNLWNVPDHIADAVRAQLKVAA